MLSLAFPAIDPIAIAIGPIAIRWYALAYIAGLLLGWRYVVHYCSKTPNIMSKRDIDDLLFWATLGVILGGRTGDILFYNLDYYLANPANILKVWQGGMAFHGGFMGVIIAIILFARKRGISILAVLDAAAVAAPIGLFFGRIAIPASFTKPRLKARSCLLCCSFWREAHLFVIVRELWAAHLWPVTAFRASLSSFSANPMPSLVS